MPAFGEAVSCRRTCANISYYYLISKIIYLFSYWYSKRDGNYPFRSSSVRGEWNDLDHWHLIRFIKKHVTPGSTVYTDEFAGYNKVRYLRSEDGIPLQYRHRRIKHSDGVYVKGDIHTNTVEGLWSLIKNGIRGVYHNVSPEYLQSYLDEYTFRYNRRFDGNQQFNAILERACERAS